MCRDCGCQQANGIARHKSGFLSTGQIAESEKIQWKPILTIEQKVLAKNDQAAKENRLWFQKHGVRVLNLISAPGSGKTTLLEKTIELLQDKIKISLLTGDQEKNYDAERLLKHGARVKQLNTWSSCHLDATMIQREIGTFVEPNPHLLIIENVGNLVCPAAFDLGEKSKIALLSTTEGEDKPSKYPLLFHEAQLIVITKMDLLPYLKWSLELCMKHIRSVNPNASVITLSATTGEGMNAWIDYLLNSPQSKIR